MSTSSKRTDFLLFSSSSFRTSSLHSYFYPNISYKARFLTIIRSVTHYLQIIKPALDKGKVVILDRFILSTLAIQNFAAGTNVINILNNLATDAVKIDATILLDISPEVALKRIYDNCRPTNKNDRKPIEWHKNIRSLLLVLGTSMREKLNTHIIDADRDEDTIFNEVIEIVKGVIKDE